MRDARGGSARLNYSIGEGIAAVSAATQVPSLLEVGTVEGATPAPMTTGTSLRRPSLTPSGNLSRGGR
jgi:hypothetical protein